MKILISSKHLASILNDIDFEKEFVTSVYSKKNGITIDTNSWSYNTNCEVSEANISVIQKNKRWDQLKILVNKIDNQPIVLKLFENTLNVIISY